jgi:hypothetical protein
VSRAVHQRDPTLSEEHLLVIVLDPGRRELARTIVTDPRLVRAETTDADGRLLSAGLWRMVGSLRIVVPDDAAAYVDVYQPRWTGRRMALDLLGSAPVP